MSSSPRWRRRSEARPDEIADAALGVFGDHGYAASRMSDIAVRAGVSKAALYRYYPAKAELFRAVLLRRVGPRVGSLAALAEAAEPTPATLAGLLEGLTAVISGPDLPKLARIVVAESRNFPEIANAWREAVVEPALGALRQLILRGQAADRFRAGDARLMAMSVVGPLLLGAIWREVMEPAGGEPLDLAALAREHGRTLVDGFAPGADTRAAATPPA